MIQRIKIKGPKKIAFCDYLLANPKHDSPWGLGKSVKSFFDGTTKNGQKYKFKINEVCSTARRSYNDGFINTNKGKKWGKSPIVANVSAIRKAYVTRIIQIDFNLQKTCRDGAVALIKEAQEHDISYDLDYREMFTQFSRTGPAIIENSEHILAVMSHLENIQANSYENIKRLIGDFVDFVYSFNLTPKPELKPFNAGLESGTYKRLITFLKRYRDHDLSYRNKQHLEKIHKNDKFFGLAQTLVRFIENCKISEFDIYDKDNDTYEEVDHDLSETSLPFIRNLQKKINAFSTKETNKSLIKKLDEIRKSSMFVNLQTELEMEQDRYFSIKEVCDIFDKKHMNQLIKKLEISGDFY